MELSTLVQSVAESLTVVDGRCPAHVTRSGRRYHAGIGPYPENAALALVIEQLNARGVACGQSIAYPSAPRQKCDVWVGEPTESLWR